MDCLKTIRIKRFLERIERKSYLVTLVDLLEIPKTNVFRKIKNNSWTVDEIKKISNHINVSDDILCCDLINVFLIDDNENFLQTVLDVFEDHDNKQTYNVVTYTELPENIDFADIVITDWFLNDGNTSQKSIELIRNKNDNIPILIMSGLVETNSYATKILRTSLSQNCKFIEKSINYFTLDLNIKIALGLI